MKLQLGIKSKVYFHFDIRIVRSQAAIEGLRNQENVDEKGKGNGRNVRVREVAN